MIYLCAGCVGCERAFVCIFTITQLAHAGFFGRYLDARARWFCNELRQRLCPDNNPFGAEATYTTRRTGRGSHFPLSASINNTRSGEAKQSALAQTSCYAARIK